jgi:hypothetical protein
MVAAFIFFLSHGLNNQINNGVVMKKLLFIVPFILILSGFIANRIIDEKMKQLLQKIGVSESYAQQMIFSNCSGNYFNPPNLRTIKSYAAGDRTALVSLVGNYLKEVTSSPDFIKRYNEYCETQKPKEPEKPKTIAQMKEEQRETFKKAIKDMEETKNKMPKDQQAMFDETIKSYQEQLKEIDDPNNPMFSKDMENMYQQGYQQQMTEYKNKLADWNKEYPDNNPKPMIKKWISSFLEKTANVDYSAKTATDQYGRELFINQKYEQKDNLWKMSYRAGKQPMEAARSFAQSWLNELK